MAKRLIEKHWFLSVIIALLFVFIPISTAPSAPLLDEDRMRRDDMLEIAERFAEYPWTATAANIRHDDPIHTPDDETPPYEGW